MTTKNLVAFIISKSSLFNAEILNANTTQTHKQNNIHKKDFEAKLNHFKKQMVKM